MPKLINEVYVWLTIVEDKGTGDIFTLVFASEELAIKHANDSIADYLVDHEIDEDSITSLDNLDYKTGCHYLEDTVQITIDKQLVHQ